MPFNILKIDPVNPAHFLSYRILIFISDCFFACLLKTALIEHKLKGQNDKYVFVKYKNNKLPLDETSFYHAWHNFCREMDIANCATVYRNQTTKSTLAPDLEPYLLRHTFCTDCQSAGVPLNVAKELMGHGDISVTAKIYTHMLDEVFEQNRKQLTEYANQKDQKAVNE